MEVMAAPTLYKASGSCHIRHCNLVLPAVLKVFQVGPLRLLTEALGDQLWRDSIHLLGNLQKTEERSPKLRYLKIASLALYLQ